MGVIQIENMEFYAFHGCFIEEQIIGNQFLVDLRIETEMSKPAETDDINDALNYQIAYNLVIDEMKQKSHLLENIAKRILDTLYSKFDNIEKAEVKVSKMNPPMGGKIERVSVTLSR
ncbi:MAG: dihydroneopterin aldolase [Bacteroidales bacterium]|jgi:dihydroneopterin aldolase|nr:dihydroneopterin aldolase [Bacteroidales bacterium]